MDLDNIIVPDDISVQSNEERIVIDPITRVINIPENYIIGVESDEKSDRMYFQCPKIVGDNVDLSKLKLYVNFENANKERDNYFVDDVTVNEGNILFSWLFSRKVTKYKGDVKFIVCAKKSEDNLTLEWNTTVAKGLSLEGIEVELSDEEQSIASDYLIQLEKELSALAESENSRLLTTSSNQITNITNKGSEQVQLVENTAKKALDSIPSTYTDLQKQVNEVEDRELKDANGITQELTITDGYAQLTDTATKRLDSLVIKGNTVQNSTKGLNLINCTSKTTTKNGITMVNNGDGTYTVNGTATDDFDIALAPYTAKQMANPLKSFMGGGTNPLGGMMNPQNMLMNMLKQRNPQMFSQINQMMNSGVNPNDFMKQMGVTPQQMEMAKQQAKKMFGNNIKF